MSPAGRSYRGTNKLGSRLAALQMSGQAQRPVMTQAQIDRKLQYLLLEMDDQKKDIFNSLSRIQNLMMLDVTYIDKREELRKRLHN